MEPMYLSIQPVETGKRIKQLLSEQNYTIREIQGAFGFENPQAIYKWISGKSLPSLVIDGDIPRLGVFLNQRFNDFLSLPPYNRVTRN